MMEDVQEESQSQNIDYRWHQEVQTNQDWQYTSHKATKSKATGFLFPNSTGFNSAAICKIQLTIITDVDTALYHKLDCVDVSLKTPLQEDPSELEF